MVYSNAILIFDSHPILFKLFQQSEHSLLLPEELCRSINFSTFSLGRALTLKTKHSSRKQKNVTHTPVALRKVGWGLG